MKPYPLRKIDKTNFNKMRESQRLLITRILLSSHIVREPFIYYKVQAKNHTEWCYENLDELFNGVNITKVRNIIPARKAEWLSIIRKLCGDRINLHRKNKSYHLDDIKVGNFNSISDCIRVFKMAWGILERQRPSLHDVNKFNIIKLDEAIVIKESLDHFFLEAPIIWVHLTHELKKIQREHFGFYRKVTFNIEFLEGFSGLTIINDLK